MTEKPTEKPAHAGLDAALLAAQAEMKVAQKDALNPHLQTNYADLASVMTACKDALNRNGILILQQVESEGESHSLKTTLRHAATGEFIAHSLPLLLQQKSMQGLGAALTYARRYGLMALAGVAAGDDEDDATAHVQAVEKTRQGVSRITQDVEDMRSATRRPESFEPAPPREAYTPKPPARDFARLADKVCNALKLDPQAVRLPELVADVADIRANDAVQAARVNAAMREAEAKADHIPY